MTEQTVREWLPYNYSDKEIVDLSKALGRETQQHSSLETKKASIVKDMGAQIALKKAEVDRLSLLVTNGYEYRDIECQWILDMPERNRKTLFRKDTGELVREALMDAEDKQASFEFDKQQREKDEAEAKARESAIADESRMIAAPAEPGAEPPIEVQTAVEITSYQDDNGTYLFAEGHVPKERFIEEADKLLNGNGPLQPQTVKHLWRRQAGDGQFGWCKKRDDGAEPVTIAHV